MSYLSGLKASYHPPDITTARHKRSNDPPDNLRPIQATIVTHPPRQDEPAPELPKDNGLNGGGFQVLIQTQEGSGANILTKEGLLRHVSIMEEVAQYTIDAFGQ